jgi:hypothetical protein
MRKRHLVRLDRGARETPEAEARSRRVTRPDASEASTHLRRERIRRQSKAVGEYVAKSREAAAFYDDWGGR